MNNEINQKHNPCVLLQAKSTQQPFNAHGFGHEYKRKAAQRMIEKSERARQLIGAILGAIILILVLAL